MAINYKYYELRGPTWKHNYPSGMFRRVETDEGVWYERIDILGNWIQDMNLARHFGGYSDGADEITSEFAAEVEEYFKSGKALKDKEMSRAEGVSTLERAIMIATRAHEGATDKGGHPYILHPLRVMLAMDSTEERITAVLHDVLEDTALTMAELREEGFSEAVLHALEVLTKKQEDEDYITYVLRAGTDPLAKKVKLADLTDNMGLSRIPHPTERDLQRYLKYRRAFDALQAEGEQQTPVQGNGQLHEEETEFPGRRVVLRNIRDEEGTQHLQAKLTREGDLVIEGQDLGRGVQRALGVYEYEWVWTIHARDVPSLLAALGKTSGVLSALRECFSGDRAAGLGSFLESHDIPHETWSRMGD